MKNAGSRHRMTCSRAYHFASSSDSFTAPSKRGVPTGRKYNRPSKPASQAAVFSSAGWDFHGFQVLVSCPFTQSEIPATQGIRS